MDDQHQAGKLGNSTAYYNIGNAYKNGEGLEVDKEKAKYYYELAAMKGDVKARNNLGVEEVNTGKYDRALKHFMIAVEGGNNYSLETIRKMVRNGHATKDDYSKALITYQEYLNEIKSDQRDKVATADGHCKYY